MTVMLIKTMTACGLWLEEYAFLCASSKWPLNGPHFPRRHSESRQECRALPIFLMGARFTQCLVCASAHRAADSLQLVATH